jgi:hypothetical protein
MISIGLIHHGDWDWVYTNTAGFVKGKYYKSGRGDKHTCAKL